jgi:hypothetical protein
MHHMPDISHADDRCHVADNSHVSVEMGHVALSARMADAGIMTEVDHSSAIHHMANVRHARSS